MKTLLSTLILLAACLSASGAELVTATISITNGAGTTNGQTIVVNGVTRTWTNNVVAPGSQILTNSTATGSATNLFNEFSTYPFSGLSLAYAAPTNVTLSGISPATTVTVTLSAGWGTLTYSTQAVTAATAIRVPMSVFSPGARTNAASQLVSDLNDYSTNAVFENSILAQHLAGLTNIQTIGGKKTFTNTANVYFGGTFGSPTTTNLVNYGLPLTSVGAGVNSLQLGVSAEADGTLDTAVGYAAFANGGGAAALGSQSHASGSDSTAAGVGSTATAANSTAIGNAATASAPNSTALGDGATVAATHTNSTAVGYNATTTAKNQMMLGSSGISVAVNNALSVGGGATFVNGTTNLWQTGTNTFLAGADVAFTRYALSSLANGNNAAVPVGTNVFVEVSGPSGAFTINGINGQLNRDGKFLIILNRTGFNMTIAHDSGVDATAANRIYCLTAADKTVTGNSAAMLIYNANVSRWICLSFTQ